MLRLPSSVVSSASKSPLLKCGSFQRISAVVKHRRIDTLTLLPQLQHPRRHLSASVKKKKKKSKIETPPKTADSSTKTTENSSTTDTSNSNSSSSVTTDDPSLSPSSSNVSGNDPNALSSDDISMDSISHGRRSRKKVQNNDLPFEERQRTQALIRHDPTMIERYAQKPRANSIWLRKLRQQSGTDTLDPAMTTNLDNDGFEYLSAQKSDDPNGRRRWFRFPKRLKFESMDDMQYRLTFITALMASLMSFYVFYLRYKIDFFRFRLDLHSFMQRNPEVFEQLFDEHISDNPYVWQLFGEEGGLNRPNDFRLEPRIYDLRTSTQTLDEVLYSSNPVLLKKTMEDARSKAHQNRHRHRSRAGIDGVMADIKEQDDLEDGGGVIRTKKNQEQMKDAKKHSFIGKIMGAYDQSTSKDGSNDDELAAEVKGEFYAKPSAFDSTYGGKLEMCLPIIINGRDDGSLVLRMFDFTYIREEQYKRFHLLRRKHSEQLGKMLNDPSTYLTLGIMVEMAYIYNHNTHEKLPLFHIAEADRQTLLALPTVIPFSKKEMLESLRYQRELISEKIKVSGRVLSYDQGLNSNPEKKSSFLDREDGDINDVVNHEIEMHSCIPVMRDCRDLCELQIRMEYERKNDSISIINNQKEKSPEKIGDLLTLDPVINAYQMDHALSKFGDAKGTQSPLSSSLSSSPDSSSSKSSSLWSWMFGDSNNDPKTSKSEMNVRSANKSISSSSSSDNSLTEHCLRFDRYLQIARGQGWNSDEYENVICGSYAIPNHMVLDKEEDPCYDQRLVELDVCVFQRRDRNKHFANKLKKLEEAANLDVHGTLSSMESSMKEESDMKELDICADILCFVRTELMNDNSMNDNNDNDNGDESRNKEREMNVRLLATYGVSDDNEVSVAKSLSFIMAVNKLCESNQWRRSGEIQKWFGDGSVRVTEAHDFSKLDSRSIAEWRVVGEQTGRSGLLKFSRDGKWELSLENGQVFYFTR